MLCFLRTGAGTVLQRIGDKRGHTPIRIRKPFTEVDRTVLRICIGRVRKQSLFNESIG